MPQYSLSLQGMKRFRPGKARRSTERGISTKRWNFIFLLHGNILTTSVSDKLPQQPRHLLKSTMHISATGCSDIAELAWKLARGNLSDHDLKRW